jgi:hypothetical protein
MSRSSASRSSRASLVRLVLSWWLFVSGPFVTDCLDDDGGWFGLIKAIYLVEKFLWC